MTDDDTYADLVRGMADDSLAGEMMSVKDRIVAILEGHDIDPSKWDGFGGSLVVYGMHLCSEAERRLWPGTGEWITLRPFLVQAQYMMAALGERIEKPKDLEGKKRMNVEGKGRMPASSSQLICRVLGCGRRPGFTNIGTPDNPWWVCGNCMRPTERWFQSQGDAVLNLFRGGPLSGMVYNSSLLLTDLRLAHVVLGYTWTEELVKSEKTQMVARVWLFSNELPDRVTPIAQPTSTESPNEGVTMTAEAPPVPVPDPAPAPAPAPAPEPVDVSDLLTNRNALKVSRTVVANKAGITVAQLYRIETGGKRTTAEEAAKVRQALVELKAEQPAPGEAANPE